MNRNLNEAIERIGRADALMYAIENCYLDIEVYDDQQELAEKGIHTFYATWDEIKAIKKLLEKLDGDRVVVDVIAAVRKSRKSSEP